MPDAVVTPLADPVTSGKGLTQPTPGGDTGIWGGIINTDLALIDSALASTIYVAVSGNTVLTSTQAQNTGYAFTGALSGAATITWPPFSGFAILSNRTSGGYGINCGLSSGLAASVPSSGTLAIWSDGSNFLSTSFTAGGSPSTGTGRIVLQTSPTIYTPIISGAITLQGAVSGASVLTAPSSGGGTIIFPLGNRTLATNILDNVTITGDVTNVGTAFQVVNLSNVTNASLPPSAFASGYVTYGSTRVSLGAQSSGISGLTTLTFLPSSTVVGSGLTITGISGLLFSGATSAISGSNTTLNGIAGIVLTSGAVVSGTAMSITGVSSMAMSGAGSITGSGSSLTGFSNINVGSGTITGSGYTITGLSNIIMSGSPTITASGASYIGVSSISFAGTSGSISNLNSLNGGSPNITLFQSSLKLIMPPSGTMDASGAITFGTALPTTYGNAYCYMNGNTIQVSGQPAGWYFIQCISPVSGRFYNNLYVSGQPTIPGALTPFVCGGTGAYSGATTMQTTYSYSMPSNTMAARSTLRITAASTVSPTSGKTMQATLGGTTFMSFTLPLSGASSMRSELSIANQEASNVQFAAWMGMAGPFSQMNTSRGAVPTSTSQAVNLSIQTAAATDYMTLEHLVVELIKGP